MILLKQIINILIKFKIIKSILTLIRPKFIILYYHGVVDNKKFLKLRGPEKNLFISKNNFEKQILFLKNKNIKIMSMDDLYKENFSPKIFSVVITFDDGYKNNLKNVYPIMNKYNFPFIIYVISGVLKHKWVWWHEVWSLIKDKKSIIFNRQKVNLNSNLQKNNFFLMIKNELKKFRNKDQIEFIKKNFNKKILNNMKELFLNNEEIKKLTKNKIVTIGSHGHEHLCYKNFDTNVLINDARLSKNILQKIFNKSIKHFSFPYGNENDIKFKEHFFLKKIRYQTGVTTFDYSYKKFNKFYLCRHSIGPNVNIHDFERKLLGIDSFLRKVFLR